MIENNEKTKLLKISNSDYLISLSYETGLLINDVIHQEKEVSWLMAPTELFVLEINGEEFSASTFEITNVSIVEDGPLELVSFDLKSPSRWLITARVSIYSEAENSYMLLLQFGAQWPDNCPEQVFMHLPIFKEFGGDSNNWILSSNPSQKPNGSSVIQTHDGFDLPICNIAEDRKTGFSMEFRDINLHGFGWNQLRNCDFLHITEEEHLLNNRVLLRLQNNELVDVFEVRLFGLTDGWSEAFNGWRRRIRNTIDLSEYDRADLQWYRKVLYQHFTFAYSKEVFNYDTLDFEPERLISEGNSFGGYDSLLLWFQYPRLGVDERNQWDFNKDIPGGLAGVRDFTQKAKKQGVRVFLPYKPWDLRFDESPASVVDNIVNVVKETGIDGIWFDTMNSVPEGLRERIDKLRPGVVFCTEIHPQGIDSIEQITGHWDQFFELDAMPGSNILRYIFPENNAPITSRWRVGAGKDIFIKRAIFNGTGVAIWQDIFGAWLPFDTKQKADLRKWKEILLANFDTFFGSYPIPSYPALQEGLYINKFPADNGKHEIYTIYNAKEIPVEGNLFEINSTSSNLKELWRDAKLSLKASIVHGKINPEEVLIAAVEK